MFEKLIMIITSFFGKLFGKGKDEMNTEPSVIEDCIDHEASDRLDVFNEVDESVSEDVSLSTCDPAEGYVIMVDNGHGKETKGKRSPWCATKSKPEIEFYEWSWNRKAAKAIVDRLKSEGYDARLVVTEDTDVTLGERCRRVNKISSENGINKTLLISIHANAAGNGSKWMAARGWSAYTTRGATKADKLCECLYEEAEKNFKGMKIRRDWSDGDSDIESDFYILKHTMCPAVLSENFFYDNIEDARYILSDHGLENVVKTHVDGVKNYLNAII